MWRGRGTLKSSKWRHPGSGRSQKGRRREKANRTREREESQEEALEDTESSDLMRV
jgi:hypothetical protein